MPSDTTYPCTQAATILEAAEALTRLGRPVFSAEALVVAAWAIAPNRFSMTGFPQYPDSNKVLANLMGRTGLVSRQQLERTGAREYRLPPSHVAIALSEDKLDRVKRFVGAKPFREPNDDELVPAILRTRPAGILSKTNVNGLCTADLLEVLNIVHPSPSTQPREAADRLKDRLRHIEQMQGSTHEVRFAQNVFTTLAGRFLHRILLAEDTGEK